MKEISLKKPAEKMSKESMAIPALKDSYPSFNCYDNAPDDLMSIPMGKEVMAKVRKCSEDTHKGDKSRKSCGFEVISIMIKDEDMMKKVMEDVKLPKEHQEAVMNKYKG